MDLMGTLFIYDGSIRIGFLFISSHPSLSQPSPMCPKVVTTYNLKVGRLPSSKYLHMNQIVVSPVQFATMKEDLARIMRANPSTMQGLVYAQISGSIFVVKEDEGIDDDTFGIGKQERTALSLIQRRPTEIGLFLPDEECNVGGMRMTVDVESRRDRQSVFVVDCKELSDVLLERFFRNIFGVGQKFSFEFLGKKMMIEVNGFSRLDISGVSGREDEEVPPSALQMINYGRLTREVALSYSRHPEARFKLTGQDTGPSQLFKSDFNLNDLGIGGLSGQFSEIFRRAFASRIFPPSVIEKLGLQHVKGVLLYGPPGTGKTLMARQIGRMLNAKPPKIINGPEIMDKYVGKSEENIRKLFEDAEEEYAELGDDSDLHIIIFDEIDAICRQRGSHSDSVGVHDSVVNQLLSKMDGVEAVNNVLVIGMTNRKDLIDEALLRPGRFEVHLEIGLPDEEGCHEIYKIHTHSMKESGSLSEHVDLADLARRSKNYSGAEISGVCRSAASYALNRLVSVTESGAKVDADKILVTPEDFEHGLVEVPPAYGVESDDLSACTPFGIMPFIHSEIVEKAMGAVDMVRRSSRIKLGTMLISGERGIGKTALAAMIASKAGAPFTRIISAQKLVTRVKTEHGRVSEITRVFEDAYKVPFGVIILDNLESLVEWVPIGARYSNLVLQSLIAFLQRIPENGRRLLVICTTSVKMDMGALGLLAPIQTEFTLLPLTVSEACNALLESEKQMPEKDSENSFPPFSEELREQLRMADEETPLGSLLKGITIKKLLINAELARAEASFSGATETTSTHMFDIFSSMLS
eukprot:gnl/Chilomastix_cuspidata/438.p1 GENE.gnl/Chilomastix_cuspidata/438~~gnl/Chilomastix_cuspidata/438.p1  ORF type:complete len:809 (+),score=213.63 gnl/Chilomastix_cuspidata/438:158-2584(+)